MLLQTSLCVVSLMEQAQVMQVPPAMGFQVILRALAIRHLCLLHCSLFVLVGVGDRSSCLGIVRH